MLNQLQQIPLDQPIYKRLYENRPLKIENTLDFKLPASLEAGEPPEARGLARDKVRLMVSHYTNDSFTHHDCFCEFDSYLKPGDVLVINTSGTLPAALPAEREDGTQLELHLSTRLPETADSDLWVVELRLLAEGKTSPFLTATAGERVCLPEGGELMLLAPYSPSTKESSGVRLWIAQLFLSDDFERYLNRHGYPIRYN
jgi:S-adenosylmethionine:tRNA ribosyltransferase-isomerase